jgi:hypothetical protein
MAHRPYPNRDRALRQLARHEPTTPPVPVTPGLLAVADFVGRMRGYGRHVVTSAGLPVGEYRMSTR